MDLLELIDINGGVRKATIAAAVRAARTAKELSKDEQWLMLETGTWRGCAGDGLSTWFFGLMANEFGGSLLSIDIDQEQITKSIEHVRDHEGCSVTHHCSDSITFLSKLSGTIGFAYLDSMDYRSDVPLPSQMHNFGEACAIIGKMSEHAVILCDDANYGGGGKPFLTIPWLQERGWKLIMKDEQALLTNWDWMP